MTVETAVLIETVETGETARETAMLMEIGVTTNRHDNIILASYVPQWREQC